MLSTEKVEDWLSRRHAGSPSEAAVELGIARQQAVRLLDELVEAGAAERLRPIGCDHSRHDHYRLRRPLAAVIGHSSMFSGTRRIATPRHYPMSKGYWRTATANTNNQRPMTAAQRPNDHMTNDQSRGTLSYGRLPLLRWAAAWLAAVLSVFVLVVHVAAGEPAEAREDLETLDVLVDRWMALRTTIAEEKRDWEARRGQWGEEIALLEQEAATLKNEIDEGDTFASSVEKKRAEALARKERMDGQLGDLRAVLDRAEADLRRWRERIPPGLMASATGFDALPATQKEAEKLPLTKRAQTVAALYAQIETMQNRFHATRETLDVGGTRRQVDVLYVGLARAFAVSPANDWAATGVPSNKAWTWIPAIQDAAAVRRAIDVLNRQETARLVALPMQVAEEVEP